MSIKIFEVSFNAKDVDAFVSSVRLVGNLCHRNETRGLFEVFSRNEYAPNFPINEIIALEIQQSVNDLLDANPDGLGTDIILQDAALAPEQKRPGSLADILKMRGPLPSHLDVTREETPGQNPLADMSDETMETSSENAMDQDEQEERETSAAAEADAFDNDTLETAEQDEAAYQGTMGDDDAQESHDTPEFPDAVEGDDGEGDQDDQFAALRSVANSLSNARKDMFLREIGKLLEIDVTSDTEIMHALAESGNLKRLLSVLYARMGIQISMTVTDYNLRTQSQTLTFRPDSIESVDHYRRGASELLTRVEALLEDQTQMDTLRTEIKTLEKSLASQEAQAARQIASLSEDMKTAQRKLVPVPVFAARFNLYFVRDGQNHFITVPKGMRPSNKPDMPVSYALKELGASMRQGEAHRFLDLDSARSQRDRLQKYPQNFAPFAGMTTPPEVFVARLGVDRVLDD